MKHLLKLALAGLAALLAPLSAQTLPTPTATTVTAVPATGVLRTPANFFEANADAISASISDATGLIPFEEPTGALGVTATGQEFLLWSPLGGGTLEEGFAGWVNAATFRDRLGLGTGDTPLFAGVQVFGEAQALTLSLGLNGTVLSGAGVGGITLQLPGLSGTLLTTTGNGGGLSALNASAITTGALDNARLDPDLAALGNNATSGLLVRTGAGTAAARTLATTAPLALTNADGVAGNPSLTVAAATESAVGVVELATAAEAITGTDTTRPPHAAAARAALSAYVDPIAATRQGLLGWMWSDASTANRRVEWTMGAAGNVAGSPLSEVGHVFRVPSANPAVSAGVFEIGSSNTGTNVHNIRCSMLTTGALRIEAGGAIGGTDYRRFDYAGFRAAYSGQLTRLDFVFSPGTTNPAIFINGVDASASFTLTTSGTAPNWMDAGLVSSIRLCGLNWPNAEFRSGTPINRALTAAEITQMVQTGALLPIDRLGGSVSGGYLSNFAAGADGWSPNAANNTVAGNIDTDADGAGTPPSADWLRITKTVSVGGTDVSINVDRPQMSRVLPAPVGAQLKLKGSIFTPASFPAGIALGVRNGPTYQQILAITPGTEQAFDFTHLVPSGQSPNFIILGICQIGGLTASVPSGTNWYLKNLDLNRSGALLQPEITRTAQVLDHGPNRIRGIATAGIRPLSARDPEPVDFTLTTTGAFVTGGSTNPLWFEPGMITHVFAMTDTAGADLTLRRNSSSTNDIVTAATDLPTANVWVPVTVIDAQRMFASGETLWGASSAGTIRFRLFWTRN